MKRHRAIVVMAAGICLCLLVGLSLLRHEPTGPSSGPPQTMAVDFEEARNRAFEQIRQRELWPESPEAVSRAFWDARATRNYEEMEVLWPGSASFNWPEICGNEPNVTYVFGPAFRQAGKEGVRVPYGAKDQFDAQETYNLTMQLGVLHTNEGPRYYIVSGN